MRAYWYLTCFTSLIFEFGHKFLQLTMLVPFILTTKSIKAENIYIGISCIQILHGRLLQLMPYYISNLLQTIVSINRIIVSYWNVYLLFLTLPFPSFFMGGVEKAGLGYCLITRVSVAYLLPLIFYTMIYCCLFNDTDTSVLKNLRLTNWVYWGPFKLLDVLYW